MPLSVGLSTRTPRRRRATDRGGRALRGSRSLVGLAGLSRGLSGWVGLDSYVLPFAFCRFRERRIGLVRRWDALGPASDV